MLMDYNLKFEKVILINYAIFILLSQWRTMGEKMTNSGRNAKGQRSQHQVFQISCFMQCDVCWCCPTRNILQGHKHHSRQPDNYSNCGVHVQDEQVYLQNSYAYSLKLSTWDLHASLSNFIPSENYCIMHNVTCWCMQIQMKGQIIASVSDAHYGWYFTTT